MKSKYTEVYKTSAVKMVVEEGKMPVEVAGNLGMPVGLLYKWIRQYKGIDSQGKANGSQEQMKRPIVHKQINLYQQKFYLS